MLNKVILIGNVGRAPKISLTQNGKKIATFFVATSHSWKDETGEWQSLTDWHRVLVFREPTVRWIEDVLKRGDGVTVEGKLTYHQWTDKFGQHRLTANVVVASTEGKVQLLFRISNDSRTQSSPVNSDPNSEQIIADQIVSEQNDPIPVTEQATQETDKPFEYSQENQPQENYLPIHQNKEN